MGRLIWSILFVLLAVTSLGFVIAGLYKRPDMTGLWWFLVVDILLVAYFLIHFVKHLKRNKS